jgi:predicted HTH transcriptional regulator
VSKYIKRLIREGEHQRQDFKYEISDSKKIARTLAAFSNAEGGRLLIGVKDNGSVTGVTTDEEYYMIEAAAKMYCKPEVPFTAKSHHVEGKIVFEVKVVKSLSIPHLAPDPEGKWLAYVRVGDQNLVANNILLTVWEKQKNKEPVFISYSRSERILLDYLDKNEKITLPQFAKLATIPIREAESTLVDFIILGIIDIELTKTTAKYRLNKNSTAFAEYFGE